MAQNCASQAVAIPNFSSNQVVLYDANGVLYKTLNVPVSLLSPPGGTNLGINSVVFINADLFVGVANANGNDFGGILHYTVNQVQNNLNPTVLATPNNQPVIALSKDAAHNLFASTAVSGNHSGVICRYTAASNYAANSLKTLPITEEMGWWVQAFGAAASYNANTLFTTDVFGNAVICYHEIDWAATPVTANITVLKDVQGNAPYLFSLPEGIVLDTNNDLWISSNNDSYSTQLNATGNLTHLTQTMWQNHIAAGNPNVITIDAGLPGVERFEIWENGVNATMLGGMVVNGNCLYLNNQKNGSNVSILQYNIMNNTTTSTTLTQTYPGYGGLDIYSNTAFDPTFTAISSPQNNPFPELSAFPNPTTESIALKWNMAHIEATTLHIYNVVGKEMLAPLTITGTEAQLNLSSLPQGIYFISLQTNESKALNTKIVKE